MQEPQTVGQVLNRTYAENRCERCGCGYKHIEVDGQHRKWCKRCIDVYRRRESLDPDNAERRILNLVGLLYGTAKLDDFDESVRGKLLNLEHSRDVFFFGPPGRGKTHAMAALVRHYVYEGYECDWINFDDFCVKLRSSYAPASTLTEWDIIQPLKTIDMLFVDDLGLRSKQESDFSYVTFYTILDSRLRNCLSTFICSNKDIARLEQAFDARIASRLRTAELIEMTGRDRRGDRQ